MEEELSNLSHDYVFNYIFPKICDTIDKYSTILPDIENLDQAMIVLNGVKDPFEATIKIIDTLKAHAEKSALVKEIFENVGRDFWHGITPDEVRKHEGKYYIDSVAT